MYDGWGSDPWEEEISGFTSLSLARAQHFSFGNWWWWGETQQPRACVCLRADSLGSWDGLHSGCKYPHAQESMTVNTEKQKAQTKKTKQKPPWQIERETMASLCVPNSDATNCIPLSHSWPKRPQSAGLILLENRLTLELLLAIQSPSTRLTFLLGYGVVLLVWSANTDDNSVAFEMYLSCFQLLEPLVVWQLYTVYCKSHSTMGCLSR